MTDQRPVVESPCVRLCVIDPRTRLCEGCRRSLDEIAAWGRMTPGQRRKIMADSPSRA